MNSVICFFLGAMCGAAFQPKRQATWWLPVAAALAAMLPQIELLFYIFGESFRLQYFYGATWSILFAFSFAVGLSTLFGSLTKRGFLFFFPAVVCALALSILMGALTMNGVQLLAPFAPWRLAFSVVDVFDLGVFLLGVLGVLFCVLLRRWQASVARFFLALVVVYVSVVGTFAWKAHNFAQQYAEGFNLAVKKVYVLPQPISAFNWRIIIETEDARLHDTRINLFRTEPLQIDGSAKRSWRIYAQYKPLNQAVWRIYPRFGRQQTERAERFIHSTWHALAASNFGWTTRFVVFKQFVAFSNTQCVEYQDLIKAGANRSYAGQYLVCLAPKGYTLYKADSETTYKRLAVLEKAE